MLPLRGSECFSYVLDVPKVSFETRDKLIVTQLDFNPSFVICTKKNWKIYYNIIL